MAATDQGSTFLKFKRVDFWLGAKFNDKRDEKRRTGMTIAHPSFGGPDSGNQERSSNDGK